jgi:hypothetical protein
MRDKVAALFVHTLILNALANRNHAHTIDNIDSAESPNVHFK